MSRLVTPAVYLLLAPRDKKAEVRDAPIGASLVPGE